ncbi:2-phosphoxylose phosphatase 1-like [Mercenaria mercenaria]|uniref:2-phosphoxylose phosphatase 1-like n=1 Tax=Mercenaria mercenaria TaxID=6596 RepID=UPI00234F7608|nr:2-phosphoxylose phosphatase 1-like [Mercenaria mercenaria]
MRNPCIQTMRMLLRRRKLFKLVVLVSIIPVIFYLMVCQPNEKQMDENLPLDQMYRNKTGSDVLVAYHNKSKVHSSGYLRNSPSFSGKDETMRWIDVANDYCNSPFTRTTGNEGNIPEGFRLRNVHVFIHHGDRTSIHRSPWYGPEVFNCKFNTWYNGSNTKFSRFTDYMDMMAGKQGRRNHFLNWALYPDRDVCANSILTSRGALQHLQLGQHLSESYNRHVSLFNPKLSLTNQINVKSTSTSRTYQSAVAFLYGFLPRFNISHLKIENSPDMHFCTKQYSVQKSCYCKHAKELLILSEQIQKKFDRENSYVQKYYEPVTKLFDVASAPPVTAVAEALVPFFCHNITLPCSYLESPHGCRELIGDIWNTIIVRERLKYNDSDLNYLKYSSIVMTPVLIEIIIRIKNIVEKRPTPKFVLYSGHDVTLSPLLYVLGLQDEKWPPYASRVVIELLEHDHDASLNKFYLRFLYNGIDKTEKVIFCRGLTYKRLCSLTHFTEFVFMKMLRRFGYNSYYDACSR